MDKTTIQQGISSHEAESLLKKFGPNVIETQKTTSSLEIFLSQFPNFVNGILLFASLLSFALREVVDGVFILTILILNALFGFIQEFRSEKAVEALKKFVVPKVRVIRDGVEQEITAKEVVPDDLVVLNEGDKIPADGKLIEGVHVEVDESLLTGESLPVLKLKDADLFMGTIITRGRCQMRVSATGVSTKFGEIAKTLSQIREEKTPLNRQTDNLGKQLAIAIIVMGTLIVFIGLLQQREFFSILLTAVSISVAGIPEGLPAVITIALALGMQKMARKKALVRKMAAIETLGATQVILTDKTGTLTQNEMRVKRVWYEGSEQSLSMLLRACVLGNTASLVERFSAKSPSGHLGGPAKMPAFGWDVIGDKTDGALLLFSKEHREDLDSFLKEGEIIDEYVFDPVTKTVTTIWKYDHKESVFVRGAPERILEVSRYIFMKGKKVPITPAISVKIQDAFTEFAKEGLRIIGFGHREVTDGKKLSRKELEQKMTFLGFVGIYDPPREEAKDSVRQAREAGIQTIMVTGDNQITALSIAKEIGLIEKEEDVVTGEELRSLTDDQLIPLLKKTRIYARTTPMDKLRLVELFKKQGFIVGVTGDGVNDALALKRADVGVAMGKTGTDVAKEASDVVITDDNFASLVSAVEEGRIIYDNIVKAITFLLSANLAEVATIFFAVLFGLPTPLLPTQILWMNLVTDGLPALALASDTKDPHVLRRLPRNQRQHILSGSIIRIILLGSAIMTAITLLAFAFFFASSGINVSRAIAFNLIIGLQLIFIFFVRGKKHPLSNRFLLATIAVTIFVQAIIMLSPPLRVLFHISL